MWNNDSNWIETMTENQQCGTCVSFLVSKKDEKRGQCRYNPPQVTIIFSEPRTATKMQDNGQLITANAGIIYKSQPAFPPMMAEDLGCQQYKRFPER